tara:strand:+ start:1088 stop:3178 length:2091 start_codon:yes stop_codon:yes gene_type:complete
MKTTIGGDRLGSGNKQEVSLKNYNRSSHDLGYVWRSSMSSGTLVPFMTELALPGDSFDIDMACDVKTLPTIGPLFGSYKVQLDVFQAPVRLYQGKLHMNMLNIGMDMSSVKLPQMVVSADYVRRNYSDNAQINSSCILSYLNVRGVGRTDDNADSTIAREFNAVPLLAYWDIFKQYYANKQEEKAYVISASDQGLTWQCNYAFVQIFTTGSAQYSGNILDTESGEIENVTSATLRLEFQWDAGGSKKGLYPDLDDLNMRYINSSGNYSTEKLKDVFTNLEWEDPNDYQTVARLSGWLPEIDPDSFIVQVQSVDQNGMVGIVNIQGETPVRLQRFDLDSIDKQRMKILEAVASSTPVYLDKDSIEPYNKVLKRVSEETIYEVQPWACTFAQEGLAVKTYQSDLFNNWISTEWIDGDNGINAITSVSTVGNEFTIDALNLANKVYTMLNRIAISGGTYDDWLDAVYTHERSKSVENPIYHGSLIKELAFEEVVSQADVTDQQGDQQPLGTLAGRGRLTQKNKGGKVKIKVDEPSYILGIVSITPRVDYSQGNKWDMNLKTMNDLHKPALDAIGYQDLVTDQLAWFDTTVDADADPDNYDFGNVTYKSVGKQPAWINYMTNVNQCRGTFAEENNAMFMTLNRKYENFGTGIYDITTYIDPTKFNSIFAETSISSQNFWVQISNRITARRKMSAKVIPNL